MRGNERWRNWQNSVTPSLVDGERLRRYSNLTLCKAPDCGAVLGWGHWVTTTGREHGAASRHVAVSGTTARAEKLSHPSSLGR